MKKIKSIVMWILTAFMALVSFTYFPSVTSIIAIVFVVIAAPIEPLQEFFSKHGLYGLIKSVVLCSAFIGAIIVAPTRGVADAPAPTETLSHSDALLSAEPDTTESITPNRGMSVVLEPEPTIEPTHTSEPTVNPTPTPEPTIEPTHTPGPTVNPTPTPEPTQAPAPQPTPTQRSTPTQTPTGNQGSTTSNGDGTYTHDFSGGRVLYTTQSSNNNDPVYHTRDCRAAKIIPPENAGWYASAQAAEDAGRRICGNCNR